MKRAIALNFLVVAALWVSVSWGATQTWTWAQQADVTAASSNASASAVTTDAAGNTYVSGTFKGTIRVGTHTLTSSSGYTDVYLAKYDSAGTVLWAVAAGGMACSAGGLASDGNEVFLTGACTYGASFGGHALAASPTYESAFYLVAADANTGQFSRLLGNAGSGSMSGTALTLDAESNLLVAGSYSRTASVLGTTLTATGGGSYEDAFILKLNKAFSQVAWMRGGGGEYSDHAYTVSTDASGNVFIAGDIFSNVAQGTATFGSFTLTVPSYGSGDPFVAKLDRNGQWQWANSIQARAFDEARALAIDSAGNVYVAGRFASSATFGSIVLTPTALNSYAIFITKLDAAGNFLWAQQAGSTDSAALSDHASAYGLAVRGNGNPVMTGNYQATTSFGSFTLTSLNMSDVFVAELDAANGSYLWVKSGGGSSGNDYGSAITLAPSGKLLVAGVFDDSASFDGTSLTTGRYGEYWITDMFLASLDPEVTATTIDGTISASGSLTAQTLTLNGMFVPPTDLAGGVSLYVAAYWQGSFFFLTPSGWTTQFSPYVSAVTSVPGLIAVTDNLDLSGLVGTTVWFGYGRGSGDSALNDMLQGARYKQVYTVQ